MQRRIMDLTFLGASFCCSYSCFVFFQLMYPHCVDGLFLINCTSTAAGWTEWGYQKLNAMYLRSSGMTQSTEEYLMWHHFGKVRRHIDDDFIFFPTNFRFFEK
ncbi:hypothetical protein AVEN_7124-1 [Araneus ventricosus]|uniref:Uncharacterized protein n=1 Tax=Araneus ventricosus TaxID=182803 RepID=A0A4Y2PHZ7_ARAVE|nr:hypothetical protein AVEN_7124-1 [Araneus ventricosus]